LSGLKDATSEKSIFEGFASCAKKPITECTNFDGATYGSATVSVVGINNETICINFAVTFKVLQAFSTLHPISLQYAGLSFSIKNHRPLKIQQFCSPLPRFTPRQEHNNITACFLASLFLDLKIQMRTVIDISATSPYKYLADGQEDHKGENNIPACYENALGK